ncbi:SRPBCC family protein [Streptomyces sp. NPDC004667]|uniref:SRPBCC family protein n=1 Tax=Streptomyces sp. NPDC004667 TaxID=3154285 RepID=UPI0033B79C88
MKYELRPEDLAFTERARFRRHCTRTVKASAEAVFDQLALHPENWPRWFGPANDVHYEDQPPHGIGSTRFFRLYRVIRARERVIAWDPGRHFAYRVHEANVPGVAAVIEEWTLVPSPDAGTTVGWTLAVDAGPPVDRLLRAGHRHIDTLFHRSMRRLEDLCGQTRP